MVMEWDSAARYHPHCNATTSNAPTQCTMNGMTFIRPRDAVLFCCKSFGSSARVLSHTSYWFTGTVKTGNERVVRSWGSSIFAHALLSKGGSAELHSISSSVPLTRIGQKSKRECLAVLFFTFRPWWPLHWYLGSWTNCTSSKVSR